MICLNSSDGRCARKERVTFRFRLHMVVNDRAMLF